MKDIKRLRWDTFRNSPKGIVLIFVEWTLLVGLFCAALLAVIMLIDPKGPYGLFEAGKIFRAFAFGAMFGALIGILSRVPLVSDKLFPPNVDDLLEEKINQA